MTDAELVSYIRNKVELAETTAAFYRERGLEEDTAYVSAYRDICRVLRHEGGVGCPPVTNKP